MTGTGTQLAQAAAVLCAGAAACLLTGRTPGRRRGLLPAGGAPRDSSPRPLSHTPLTSRTSGTPPRFSPRAFPWLSGLRSLLRPRAAARRAFPPRRTTVRRPDPGVLRAALACAAACAVLALWGRSPLPLLAAVPAALLAARRRRGRQRSAAADRRRDAVLVCCLSVAGEVRAGRPPDAALADEAARLGEPASGVVAAARYGGDVPSALRAASAWPGAGGLRGVAACWQVAVGGGTSLAAGLERVAEALRAERDQREELRAQLAGPRATALMLAALPLCGLLLGTAMGVNPLHVLLHTPVGLGCLAAGVLLEGAGLAWVAALLRAAGRAAA